MSKSGTSVNSASKHDTATAASGLIVSQQPSAHGTTHIDEKSKMGEPTVSAEKQYSIFTQREKWFLVGTASVAAVFSPLTANIYFPAIPTIASQFHKSVEMINLTVTIYMVMQGISPMFWGTLSDRWGRRPMILACMIVLSLSCVGLALVPTSAYWLLMLLRCIQAAGSASTVALGAGVIADIASPSERGGLFGLFSMGPMIGPCLGPVIGGGLAQGLGWRAIFWFLCISSAACALVMLLLLPETLRSLVEDGSIVPSKFYRPIIPVIGKSRKPTAPNDRPPPKPFANPLRLFTYPDIVILLIFNGVLYAVFYSVTTTISSLFADVYPFLNQTDIGLCFLAIGGGMVFGSVITGRFLDRDYAAIKNSMIKKAQSDPEKRDVKDVTKDENFPIEMARLRTMPIYVAVFVACTIGYGWCLKARVSLAGPLILQIIIGYVTNAVMNTIQTLLLDLAPSQGSSITACNNLIRCSLGAALVSVIDLIIKALGPGWTYVLLGGICVAVSPLMWVEIRWGPVWRERRRRRLANRN